MATFIDTMDIYRRLSERFEEAQAQELTDVLAEIAKKMEEQSRVEQRLENIEKAIERLAEAQGKTEKRIAELAETQRKTEERLAILEQRMEELAEAQRESEKRISELAEAQKKTEERLAILEQRMEELAEAQRRTEERLAILEQRMEELAEAQRKTEERVALLERRMEELAKAQRESEERIAELTEAQRRTEEKIGMLITAIDNLRKEVGGISAIIGYGLEDKAYPVLPKLIKRDFGVSVPTLYRRFIFYPDGGEDELNIYGEGSRNGEKVFVIGEAKVRLSRRDVFNFTEKLERVSSVLKGEIIPLMLCYVVHPRVEEFARGQGVKIYKSYELI